MKLHYLPLLAFLAHVIPECSLKILCRSTPKCHCFPGGDDELEFQCPPAEETTVIHIEREIIANIDCQKGATNFTFDMLPNIALTKSEQNKLKLRFCPIPSFSALLNWFSLDEMKSLIFTHSNLSNFTLTKEYFAGLGTLENLDLSSNDLINIEEDAFENTPELRWLLLNQNRLELKANLFDSLLKLQFLEIAANKLGEIPDGLFRPLKNLALLHLWSNNITTINENTFAGLYRLKSLELSLNSINRISQDAFKDLTNLLQINLSMNRLKEVPDNLFSYNKLLTMIRLGYNHNLTLPKHLFSNLTSLEELYLEKCYLQSLPESIFEGTKKLRKIVLDHNLLESLPQDIFKGVTELTILTLSSNRIKNLAFLSSVSDRLKELNLESNLITSINANDFKQLKNLGVLNLRKNRISHIENDAFAGLKKLETFNLAYNNYTPEDWTLLQHCIELKEVDVSYNQITDVAEVVNLVTSLKLERLDLRHNNLTEVLIKDLQVVGNVDLSIRLDHNKIEFVSFEQVDLLVSNQPDLDVMSYNAQSQSSTMIYINDNPLKCNCYNYDLWRYFNDQMQPGVKVMFDLKSVNITCDSRNWPVKEIPPQIFTCTYPEIGVNDSACPDFCNCQYRPHDKSAVVECNGANYTQIPDVVKPPISNCDQIELHFENNMIRTISAPQNSTYYDYITSMYLSNNEIVNITRLPKNLEVLNLDNNKLKFLDHAVLSHLNNSGMNVTLHKNPWNCDCAAVNLTYYLHQHGVKQGMDDIRCASDDRRLIDLSSTDLCQEFNIIYIVLPIVCILLLISVTIALYYRYQQEIKVWLFAKNLCLWFVTEEDVDKDKTYDAFISYSHKDEDFVLENLVPVLEGGTHPYKICLHIRDFFPGEFISTQITNSINDSKRTIVVLSPNFVESEWGKMEFRTAHSNAMCEGRTRVIVVLYGEVDVDNLDSELKSYLRTNTYVKWGDPYFWNKMRYALPHAHKNIIKNNQKHANMMNFIDDKYNLTKPTTPNLGSTPPVLTLDPGLLKSHHPLEFVANIENGADTDNSTALMMRKKERSESNMC